MGRPPAENPPAVANRACSFSARRDEESKQIPHPGRKRCKFGKISDFLENGCNKTTMIFII
ncbi:MAG TPA: hypothetical protein DD433_06500 [Ruminococcaceae bacterium]|nr:hypothetical protein [Oscillospiraceae bacterium]